MCLGTSGELCGLSAVLRWLGTSTEARFIEARCRRRSSGRGIPSPSTAGRLRIPRLRVLRLGLVSRLRSIPTIGLIRRLLRVSWLIRLWLSLSTCVVALLPLLGLHGVGFVDSLDPTPAEQGEEDDQNDTGDEDANTDADACAC